MTDIKIIEGNELIAKFMGYQILHKKFQYRNWNSSNESYFENGEGEIVCDKNGHEINLYPDGDPLDNLSQLPFNSWEWIMPVVEKIESLGYFCMINKWTSVYTGTEHNRIYVTTVEGNTKILNTWMAVIKFIKWYNENKV